MEHTINVIVCSNDGIPVAVTVLAVPTDAEGIIEDLRLSGIYDRVDGLEEMSDDMLVFQSLRQALITEREVSESH